MPALKTEALLQPVFEETRSTHLAGQITGGRFRSVPLSSTHSQVRYSQSPIGNRRTGLRRKMAIREGERERERERERETERERERERDRDRQRDRQ